MLRSSLHLCTKLPYCKVTQSKRDKNNGYLPRPYILKHFHIPVGLCCLSCRFTVQPARFPARWGRIHALG
jgi:hypothetical protein